MASTQKLIIKTQTSTNIDDVQSKPILHGTGRTEPNVTSSTIHHSHPPPPNSGIVDDWIRHLPPEFSDVNEGVMKDLTSVALDCLWEVEVAGASHQADVIQLRQKLSLWTVGASGLDQKLAEDPELRKHFMSNLTALVLLLSTGIKSFKPGRLGQATHRVVERASTIILPNLNLSASSPPNDIIEAFNARKSEINSRIGNLYALLPNTRRVVEDFDETELQHIEEIGLDERRHSNSQMGMLKKHNRRKPNRLHSTISPASRSSSASPVVEHSHRRYPPPSRSSKEQSRGSLESTTVSSLSSDSGTYGSVHPLTDTMTSNSPPEDGTSSRESKSSNSARPLPICENCRASVRDPTGHETRSLIPYIIAHLRDQVVSLFSSHKSQNRIVEPQQLVRVWHRNGRRHIEYSLLIDTGTVENFILRSLVEELELDITRSAPKNFTALNNYQFKVDECVQPRWQFIEGSKQHDVFRFWIIPALPNGMEILLGNVTRRKLHMHISILGTALIAHKDYEDLSTRDQQQKQRERQARDAIARQTKQQQTVEETHAALIRERATGKARKTMKPRSPASQKDAVRPGDDKR